MSSTPNTPQNNISFDQIYQNFNKNDLNARTNFELLYNACLSLFQENEKSKLEKAAMQAELNKLKLEKAEKLE